MQEAYQKSRIDLEDVFVSDLNCIITKLHLIEIPIAWIVHRPNPPFFFKLSNILTTLLRLSDQ